MKRIAIIGSGDLGQQIAHQVVTDGTAQVVGFFDDFVPIGTTKGSFPILGDTDSVESCHGKKIFDELLIGIGYHHFDLRSQLFDYYSTKITFSTVIHSTSFVDSSGRISSGSVLFPGTS
ncbi:hypothetical protein ACFLR1_00920 [Bacteroidota bacterium]